MSWTVYLRRSFVIVPASAKTKAGFYMDVEPVRAAASNDIAAIAEAITYIIDLGIRVIETPTRASYGEAVVQKYANVKS